MDLEMGVIPTNGALKVGIVRSTHFVRYERSLAQRTIAMGKADRDEELLVGLIVEFYGFPLAKRGRTGPDIHGHVENLSLKTRDELILPRIQLIVEGAETVFARPHHIVLNKHRSHPLRNI